mgnify:CR=1 FL=1
MNELIGDVLAQHFITLPFVTRTAGCVEIFKKSTKSVIKKFPVAGQIYKTDSGQIYCDKSEDYQPITPNSQETGIVFFEDLGSKLVKKDSSKLTWKGSLRLVCWLNYKKIGLENQVGALQGSVLANIPAKLQPQQYFMGGVFYPSEVEPKTTSAFDKYDLSENENQFLIHPFGHFSIRLNYMVYTNRSCPINITVDPIVC